MSRNILALGLYENFPANVHMVESFNSTITSKQLQEKLVEALFRINRKELSFEEIANPTIPECKIIFEFGLAEGGSFNYLDDGEVKKALNILTVEHLQVIDFVCVIRYYKGENNTPLKFDYYLFRTAYSKKNFEIQVFHQRGPRYISPEDLTTILFNKINEGSKRQILRKTGQ